MTQQNYRHKTLREKAAMYSNLVREPGWELLKHAFRPEIRTRVSDVDSREAFLYEAIRAQVIQELLSAPYLIIHQAEREWRQSFSSGSPASAAPDDECSDNNEVIP